MNNWLQQFQEKLLNEFGDTIQFIGLQGSRARNEANDNSDIDIVVIFDQLTFEKLQRYEAIATTMADRHLLCGFVGDIEDLHAWDKADLFTFMYDTIPLYGDISVLKTMITTEDVKRFIRSTVGNIYHMTIHNYLHGKSTDMVHGLYKNIRFAIQGKVFIGQNQFITQLNELPSYTIGRDTVMIERLIALKNNSPVDLDNDTEMIVAWAKETLQVLK